MPKLQLNFRLRGRLSSWSLCDPPKQQETNTEMDGVGFCFWFVSLVGNQGILWMGWYEEAGEQEICKAAAN